MLKFLAPLRWLPLVEVIGFIIIGAKIGFFYSMIWMFAAAWIGYMLLQLRGRSAYARAQMAQADEVFAVRDMFDGLCIYIASLLLIFPGFISDFIAVLILIAPVRNMLFHRIASDPNHPARKYAGFQQTPPATAAQPEIIEGEFRRIDDPHE